MTTEITVDVRYPDCDMMGIVHHAVYPVWYEMARMDYLAELGFSFEQMHVFGIDPPMVSLNLTYHKPVRYPGTVTVKTNMLSFAPKKLELHYETYCGGELAGTGTSFHIWTGPDMKSLDMEKAHPDVYEKIRKAYEG